MSILFQLQQQPQLWAPNSAGPARQPRFAFFLSQSTQARQVAGWTRRWLGPQDVSRPTDARHNGGPKGPPPAGDAACAPEGEGRRSSPGGLAKIRQPHDDGWQVPADSLPDLRGDAPPAALPCSTKGVDDALAASEATLAGGRRGRDRQGGR